LRRHDVITSKLTRKTQAMVPRAVRAAPGHSQAIKIVTVIEAGRVVMIRAQPERLATGSFGAFAEWNSSEDIEAYARL